MDMAINLAVIEKDGLLLVKKENVWILPGGKSEKKDKSDYETLIREFNEELPGTKIFLFSYYDTFIGKTPHSNRDLAAKVYFGKVENLGRASSEINDAKYIMDFENYNLSKIIQEIVLSLRRDRCL